MDDCGGLAQALDPEAVRVWWDEPTESGQATSKTDEQKTALLDVMSNYPGTRFTVKSLQEAIGNSSNAVYRWLDQLVQSDDCAKDLQNPGKKSSNRNPWVYFIPEDE